MIIESFYQTKINGQSIIIRPCIEKYFGQLTNNKALIIEQYFLGKNSSPLSHEKTKIQDTNHFINGRELTFIATTTCHEKKIIGASRLNIDYDNELCKLSLAMKEQWPQQKLAALLSLKPLEFAWKWGIKWMYNNEAGAEISLTDILNKGVIPNKYKEPIHKIFIEKLTENNPLHNTSLIAD